MCRNQLFSCLNDPLLHNPFSSGDSDVGASQSKFLPMLIIYICPASPRCSSHDSTPSYLHWITWTHFVCSRLLVHRRKWLAAQGDPIQTPEFGFLLGTSCLCSPQELYPNHHWKPSPKISSPAQKSEPRKARLRGLQEQDHRKTVLY